MINNLRETFKPDVSGWMALSIMKLRRGVVNDQADPRWGQVPPNTMAGYGALVSREIKAPEQDQGAIIVAYTYINMHKYVYIST